MICRRSHCVMVTCRVGPYCVSERWRAPLMYVVPLVVLPAMVFCVLIFRSAAYATIDTAAMTRMATTGFKRWDGGCMSVSLSEDVGAQNCGQQDTTNRRRQPESARAAQ